MNIDPAQGKNLLSIKATMMIRITAVKRGVSQERKSGLWRLKASHNPLNTCKDDSIQLELQKRKAAINK